MITKETVQHYSKYDIFNQLEIERQENKELKDIIRKGGIIMIDDEDCSPHFCIYWDNLSESQQEIVKNI